MNVQNVRETWRKANSAELKSDPDIMNVLKCKETNCIVSQINV